MQHLQQQLKDGTRKIPSSLCRRKSPAGIASPLLPQLSTANYSLAMQTGSPSISQEDALKQQRQNGNSGESFGTELLPGQDPEKFVKENLFVKVTVNKNSCFTGEAVVATFKLYSRLQSKSEIVKNPGFYGFSVHDMVGLADRNTSTEKINGKAFEVHTIRQVQLYPLQAGDFTIDPMEIQNRIEFSRTTVSRKNEQEIEEGIHDLSSPSSTESYENSISTPPVIVHVKPVPLKNKPEDYAGATGKFALTASLEKNEVARNEEGYLIVTISGKGNFSQISAPCYSMATRYRRV
jgi:hypothetical protein